jgi:hypothetical protein
MGIRDNKLIDHNYNKIINMNLIISHQSFSERFCVKDKVNLPHGHKEPWDGISYAFFNIFGLSRFSG